MSSHSYRRASELLPHERSATHRAAVALVARGIPVFACWPNTKLPMTKRGFLDATTDEGLVNWTFARTPNANLAVPTGWRSGLLAMDRDPREDRDGHATHDALERDFGPSGETLTSQTPSGGTHLIYNMPNVEIRNSAGTFAGEIAPGWDVRGEGGYILVAPSTIDGRLYRWINRRAPADLPQRWIDALTPPPRPMVSAPAWVPSDERERTRLHAWCVRAVQDEARKVAATMPGRRNDQLWASSSALAGLVHLGAIDLSDVRTALSWACSRWSERDQRKDERCIENGIRFGVANPRHVRLEDRKAA
jgi:hypothetical protein